MQTRLEHHRQKRLVKIGIVLFVLIILFFWFGIPFVINSSISLANLFGKKKEITTQRETLRDIRISDLPEATNSASFIVSGTVSNFDRVAFYLNGAKVKDIASGSSGEFSEELDGLRPGDNQLYAQGKTDDEKIKKDKQTYTIIYKNGKPKLELSEPSDGLKTNHTEVKVSGKTDKDVTIKVNNLPVVTDPGGNFQTSIKLSNGDNKIIVTAQDKAGNAEEKTLTVNYSPEN